MTADADKKARRRENRAEAVRSEIKQAAWVQVASRGAASLSLRAVAASLGLSAPALYRYYASRDRLVTALVIDAYESLALAQAAALAPLAGSPWEELLRALGRAYRAWAFDRPAAFYMIFGAPVPGYVQPLAETAPAAAGSMSVLIRVLGLARDSGDLALPLEPPPPPGLAAALAAWNSAVHRSDPEILYLAYSIAGRVQGLTQAELGRQFAPFLADGRELFDREIERVILELKARRS